MSYKYKYAATAYEAMLRKVLEDYAFREVHELLQDYNVAFDKIYCVENTVFSLDQIDGDLFWACRCGVKLPGNKFVPLTVNGKADDISGVHITNIQNAKGDIIWMYGQAWRKRYGIDTFSLS